MHYKKTLKNINHNNDIRKISLDQNFDHNNNNNIT